MGRTQQWRRNAVRNLHLYFYILGSLCFLQAARTLRADLASRDG